MDLIFCIKLLVRFTPPVLLREKLARLLKTSSPSTVSSGRGGLRGPPPKPKPGDRRPPRSNSGELRSLPTAVRRASCVVLTINIRLVAWRRAKVLVWFGLLSATLFQCESYECLCPMQL